MKLSVLEPSDGCIAIKMRGRRMYGTKGRCNSPMLVAFPQRPHSRSKRTMHQVFFGYRVKKQALPSIA